MELELAYADPDGTRSMDGFGLGGSFALDERFHLRGDYMNVSSGRFRNNLATVAFGYNHALTGFVSVGANIDFFDDASFFRAGVRVSF